MSDDTRPSLPSGRWWLNPALARIAFGSSTRLSIDGVRDAGGDKVTQALRRSELAGFDLDDPAEREFGDYELLELIGQGGMGMVYRARQRSLDREVAVKLLSAGAWAPDELVESLRREARHAALLQHPNIITVHEMGEHAGLIFYAMRLVDGCSLSQRLDAFGAMPPRTAARMLRTVAEAVDYAHRLGVLHLDLKPANLLIDGDAPLIADFGLARRLEQALDHAHVSGTPSYMAPEQARTDGPPLAPATDVWALGAVLYEMLTGQPPFDGGDPQATLRLLHEGTVRRPSRLKPVPADLEAVCMKCLRKDPAQRYPDARALADDLGRFLEGRSVSVRPLGVAQRVLRWARRDPVLALSAGLAAAALLVGVLATSLQWRRAQASALEAAHALNAQRVLALQHAHALGRDHDALPGLAANLLASERNGDGAAATRDRRRLGYAAAAMPQLIDHFRLPQRLGSLALSPDGRRLAVGTLETGEVLLFDTRDGRRLWRVSLAAEPAFFGSGNFSREMRRLRFSGDGRYLLVGNWWPGPVVSPSGIDHWRIEVAGGALAQPQRVFAPLLDATYGPDGRYALLRRIDTHQVQLWDAIDWKPMGGLAPYDPVQPGWLVAPGAAFLAVWTSKGVDVLDPRTFAVRHRFPSASEDTSYTAWAASPDARLLALGNQQGAVSLVDPATGTQRRLLPGPAARVHWLEFSADGRWLVGGSADGSAWLWRRDDGFERGRRLHVGVPVLDASVDPASGLVRIGGADSVSVWQLSGLDDADRPAQQRAPLVRHAQPVARFASDLHPASGLFATASVDGEVRLWRLPPTPLRAHAAAPQASSALVFDGIRLVAVDGRDARIVRATDGRPLSRAFVHPQPVGFAALTADGASLVTSSGRELRVFDWRGGRLRFPPVVLPNSPMKLALDPGGRCAWASWTVDGGRPLTEAVGAFSLANGHPLAPTLRVAGGLATLAPTPDGRRLLLATADAFELRDGTSLRPLARARLAGANAVAAGNALVAVAASAPAAVRRYDVDAARWRAATPTAEPPVSVALSPDGDAQVVFLPQGQLVGLVRAGRDVALVDAPDDTAFVRAAAFSADGQVLAQGLADGVLLLDAVTGQWLAPPLRAPIPAPDLVAQLAFAPDGTSLLARTRFGRWLWWRLEADSRPAAMVAREARLLSPTRGRPPTGDVAEGERRMLRRRDPGPASPAPPRFAGQGCLPAVPDLLPRDPAAPARALDLAPFASSDPRQHSLAPTTLVAANLCGVPLGLQRLDGIDFDVRVAIRPRAGHNNARFGPQRSDGGEGVAIASGIPVPPAVSRVAALELLATSTTYVQDPPPASQPAQLDVVLHYADGSTARAPLRYGRDIGMWTEPPPATARVAWNQVLPRAEAGALAPASVNLFRVRVPNPHPERPVRSLDLVARRVTWNGATVFAITIDPVAAPAGIAARLP